jgi:hypothetical protein
MYHIDRHFYGLAYGVQRQNQKLNCNSLYLFYIRTAVHTAGETEGRLRRYYQQYLDRCDERLTLFQIKRDYETFVYIYIYIYIYITVIEVFSAIRSAGTFGHFSSRLAKRFIYLEIVQASYFSPLLLLFVCHYQYYNISVDVLSGLYI